jgi:hypothetical protein
MAGAASVAAIPPATLTTEEDFGLALVGFVPLALGRTR